MIKKLYLPLIGVAAFIILVGLFTKNPSRLGLSKNSLTKVKIGNTEIMASLADTPEKRQKGLSGVKSLNENEAMLFVFNQKDIMPSFWMKDMLISIDIIWINDGKIVKIDKNINPPPNGTSESNLSLYKPDAPIDYVLEVNAGFSDKNGFKIGTETQFDL